MLPHPTPTCNQGNLHPWSTLRRNGSSSNIAVMLQNPRARRDGISVNSTNWLMGKTTSYYTLNTCASWGEPGRKIYRWFTRQEEEAKPARINFIKMMWIKLCLAYGWCKACYLRMPRHLWAVVIHCRMIAAQNGFREMIKKALIDDDRATQTMHSETCN